MLTGEYTPVSEEEYLRLEAQSPTRHEYVNGEMFAMTGGTLRHNVIAGNVFAALRTTRCRAFMNDVRVRVQKHDAYYYPDVLVSCGPSMQSLDAESSTVEDPVLILEVLSANTEATDRREKLLAYRTLPSLAEYVLVSQDQARLEIHRRRGDIGWERLEYTGPERVYFASVDLSLDVREIYEGVPIEALTRPPGET
ncbi:MAG TPA: Uma2 family endonuclease [Burkholderiales bacterium]|nr:Uma2 family endonuclease [Burkholderiales bacterium]